MVIVPETGPLVPFVAVKEGILPVPLAASPMAGLLFVHAKVVPVTGPVTGMLSGVELLQYVWLAIGVTVGVGLTVMVKVIGVPAQPLAVGVTVMVPEMGVFVVLVVAKDVILPEPFAPRPMSALLFVQV